MATRGGEGAAETEGDRSKRRTRLALQPGTDQAVPQRHHRQPRGHQGSAGEDPEGRRVHHGEDRQQGEVPEQGAGHDLGRVQGPAGSAVEGEGGISGHQRRCRGTDEEAGHAYR